MILSHCFDSSKGFIHAHLTFGLSIDEWTELLIDFSVEFL